jgi:hypothetical protein
MAAKQEIQEVIIPSAPAERMRLRIMLEEMTHAMRRRDDEKSAVKDIADKIKLDFSISPKYATALATAMYKHNFDEIQAQHSEFQTLYEQIVTTSHSE